MIQVAFSYNKNHEGGTPMTGVWETQQNDHKASSLTSERLYGLIYNNAESTGLKGGLASVRC